MALSQIYIYIHDLLTVSKAFDKSMKHWYNGKFCSLHFCCNCRALKIISTVPRLARKPHWDFGRIPLTIVRTNLFKIILENNFPTIDSRDTPLKLLQSDFEPFLYKVSHHSSVEVLHFGWLAPGDQSFSHRHSLESLFLCHPFLALCCCSFDWQKLLSHL